MSELVRHLIPRSLRFLAVSFLLEFNKAHRNSIGTYSRFEGPGRRIENISANNNVIETIFSIVGALGRRLIAFLDACLESPMTLAAKKRGTGFDISHVCCGLEEFKR